MASPSGSGACRSDAAVQLWWVGINPNESLALMDTHTHYRAWTRERLIAKLTKSPKPEPWEVIRG